MPKTNLLLRLMAQVQDAAEAEKEMRLVAPQIEGYAAIEKHVIEPYWKIPAYQEITLYLRPRDNPSMAYDSLVALAESGWTHGGSEEDRWGVWNAAAPGTVLLSPRIRWAELQLWYSDAEGEDAAP